MIVVDTSVIYALLDARDSWHQRVAAWYRDAEPILVTTPLVLAEVDHLAMRRAGKEACSAWREDVAGGAYVVEWWADAPAKAAEVAERYQDGNVSLTDASLVVLADRMGTVDVATLDERHFRALRPLSSDGAFRLLPIDS